MALCGMASTSPDIRPRLILARPAFVNIDRESG
jgi:hypothetical protein